MYDTIQSVHYCNLQLQADYITICTATIATKPTDITTYRATITDKQLSCIITFYYDTILQLKLC